MLKPGKKGLILGGGAPNATLMSGALLAFSEAGVHFDVISCTGAGATIGLLYVAPKEGSPQEAMRQTLNFGVADEIYAALPVNYKVFNKPGAPADQFRQMLDSNPMLAALRKQMNRQDDRGLADDMSALFLQSLCPTALNLDSKGLCAHVPFVEHIVDFKKLPGVAPDFYVNAYNISDHRMETWGKETITHAHYQAALSFPFLYPPFELNGKKYVEGAVFDCLNYQPFTAPLGGAHADVETIVVLDVLGIEKLIREPRNLWDAYVVSIITPLVETARNDTELFELKYNRDAHGQPLRRVLKMPFAIPDEHFAHALDWSRSNLEKLFWIGYHSARAFCRTQRHALGIAADEEIPALE